MWATSNQLKGRKSKNWGFLEERKFDLKTIVSTLVWIASLPDCPKDVWLASPHNRVSQFFKINHTHTLIHYSLFVLFLSAELWLVRIAMTFIYSFSPYLSPGSISRYLTVYCASPYRWSSGDLGSCPNCFPFHSLPSLFLLLCSNVSEWFHLLSCQTRRPAFPRITHAWFGQIFLLCLFLICCQPFSQFASNFTQTTTILVYVLPWLVFSWNGFCFSEWIRTNTLLKLFSVWDSCPFYVISYPSWLTSIIVAITLAYNCSIKSYFFPNTVVPSYPWGICSKTPSGCLKPQIIPNLIYTMLFPIRTYL